MHSTLLREWLQLKHFLLIFQWINTALDHSVSEADFPKNTPQFQKQGPQFYQVCSLHPISSQDYWKPHVCDTQAGINWNTNIPIGTIPLNLGCAFPSKSIAAWAIFIFAKCHVALHFREWLIWSCQLYKMHSSLTSTSACWCLTLERNVHTLENKWFLHFKVTSTMSDTINRSLHNYYCKWSISMLQTLRGI